MIRTILLLTILFIFLGLPGCSEDDSVSPAETVSAPGVPAGSDSTATGNIVNFSISGAASSKGHDLEYRFDWGDGSVTPWAYSTEASHSWSTEGMYEVKARARCAKHTDAVSPWSGGKKVAVGEAITAPDTPSGAAQLDIEVTEIYTTGGAFSSQGHELEYRFDWGDGSRSSWASAPSASHSWTSEGDYVVTAQARCALHPERTSSWSEGMNVQVGETISIPEPPEGRLVVRVDQFEMYCTSGSSSSRGHAVLYQFDWQGNPFPLWTSSNCVSIRWQETGDYYLRVRARCAEHPEAVSDWSEPQFILISRYEVIVTPNIPSGPANTHVGITETYTTSGAYSNAGHQLEYQFDWGDGSQSPWSTSSDASHSWAAEGQHVVTVTARCKQHYGLLSDTSEGLTVTVDP